MIKDHILLRWASRLDEVATWAKSLLDEAGLTRIFALVPDVWLGEGVSERRAEYVRLLRLRLQSAPFTEEAKAARDKLV